MANFFNKDIKEVFSELETSEGGIKKNSAPEREQKFGQNVLDKQKKQGFFLKLLAQFKNIMIIILIISAIISVITSITSNDYESLFEGILIFVIVLINAVVGVIQEQKAENTLLALQKSTEPFAKVVREGKLEKIRVHEIVVGDVVELKAGDIIPADLRLFECNNLKCNESSLTGESNPITKSNQTLLRKDIPLAEQENMAFSGTNVVSGSGKGVVVAVGSGTEFGKIAKILSSSVKEKTPLEKNIDKIGKVLTIGILLIVAIVFVVQVLFNSKQTFLNALLTAVALAVAAIPESLPAVITIIMALGVQKLAKQNAIIKKLSAVETLGCCNVICSDKTGTLTKNEMTVKHIYVDGKIFSADEIKKEQIQKIVTIASLCNNVKIDASGKIAADATETSLINFLNRIGADYAEIKSSHKKILENEFNSRKKIMSVLYEREGVKSTYTKGAIDILLKQCSHIELSGNVVPLTQGMINKIMAANENICGEAERVLAFAYKNSTEEIAEADLIFAGFVGIIDPPREEAIKSIADCKKAGLKPIMITGDHPSTALSIAKKLGIAKSQKEVLTGSELNKLTEAELTKIIHKYSVFARTTPEHKLLIVNCLKKSGKVVAMTGDGINDAPSIKSANIGACMGITGTDVTKEVADIIISDDNFSTIVVAVKEGRTIYNNISKTILFLLSTNIVEVLGIFVTSLVMPNAIFLLPTQILFINLVTDSLPAFALGIEPSEADIMDKPPRDSSKSLLSGTIGTSIIYQGFIQSLVVLVMFVFANWRYGNGVASTMAFLTICLMQIIHAINCKTNGSIFKINILKNKFFNFSFLTLFIMILCVYSIPVLATLFNLSALNALQWTLVTVTSLAIIPLVEIGKVFIKEK